jgi:hypothetical protein
MPGKNQLTIGGRADKIVTSLSPSLTAGESGVSLARWSEYRIRIKAECTQGKGRTPMKKRMLGTILAEIAIVLSFLTLSADAQGLSGNMFQNWNLLPGGARARGMGGAFLGVSNDATAATWNPAGLIYNEGVSLTANYSLSRVGLGLDRTRNGGAFDSRSASASLSNLSSASFQAPLTLQEHEFVLSVYYDRVQDIYAKGEFVLDSVDGDPRKRNQGTPFNANFDMFGNLAMVGFGIGTVLKGPLTAGITLNLATGDGIESHHMHMDSLPERYAGTRYQEVDWYDKSDLDYSGMNVKFGALYKKERWTAALVFVPGWTLTQTLHYKTQVIRVRSEVVEPSSIMYPGPQGTKRQIIIPYTVGIGGSYHLTDNILLAADYQFRPFGREGQFQYQNDPHQPDSSYETAPTDWYNLHQVRLGIEYMRETKYGMVPLRLGLRNEPMLIGNTTNAVAVFDERSDQGQALRSSYFLPLTVSGATGDQVMGWTLAFGSGIYWSQVHLDIALEFTGYSYDEKNASLRMVRQCSDCYENVPNIEKDENGKPATTWGRRVIDEFGSYSRKYDDNRVRFSLNFTGYF